MDNIDERIQAAVARVSAEKQEETLIAASKVAEVIATNFLKKQDDRVSKSLEERKPILKNKGNQNQYEFCSKISSTFDKIEGSIAENDMNMVKEHLSAGREIIRKRTKLIKLADRDDWHLVNEYMSDDLASNSEDERHINRARRSANAKKEKYKKERNKKFYNFNRPRSEAYRPENRSGFSGYGRGRPSHSLTCWQCGRQGHLMSQCYSKRNTALAVPFNSNRDSKEHN